MLLSTLASAALLLPAAAGPLPAEPAGDHGALPWYEGKYEDLMAAAKESGKLVFLDFWTEW